MRVKHRRENFPLPLKKNDVCNQIVSISIFYCLYPLRANNSAVIAHPTVSSKTLCLFVLVTSSSRAHYFEHKRPLVIWWNYNTVNPSWFTWRGSYWNWETKDALIMEAARHLVVKPGTWGRNSSSMFLETKPVMENKRPLRGRKASFDIHNAFITRLHLFILLKLEHNKCGIQLRSAN